MGLVGGEPGFSPACSSLSTAKHYYVPSTAELQKSYTSVCLQRPLCTVRVTGFESGPHPWPHPFRGFFLLLRSSSTSCPGPAEAFVMGLCFGFWSHLLHLSPHSSAPIFSPTLHSSHIELFLVPPQWQLLVKLRLLQPGLASLPTALSPLSHHSPGYSRLACLARQSRDGGPMGPGFTPHPPLPTQSGM